MPGFDVVTNAPPQHLHATALATAQGLGFQAIPESDWSFRAAKGNTAVSMLVGAFVPYCRFRLSVTAEPNGVSHLMLERNSPVWTGAIGVSRVKNRAKALAEAVAAALASQGAAVYEVRSY